jgi:hypothetical protein
MARLSRTNMRYLKATGRSAAKVTDRAVTGYLQWATKDHTGIVQRLCSMPKMGLIDTVLTSLVHLVISIIAAVATGALVFVVFAYGIPLLFFGHL